MTSGQAKVGSKRVEILIPVLHSGGSEVQTLYLVRALRSVGYSAGVCCYFEAAAPMVEDFEREGARVMRLGLGTSREARKPWKLLQVAREVCSHLRRVRPDVVHVQYIAPGLVPALAARAARVPTVFATVHQPGHPYGLTAKFSLRLAAGLSTAFFCVSRSAEESWFGDNAVFDPAKVAGRRHFTLYNCVDVERFAQATDPAGTRTIRNQLGLGSRPVVGFVGRLRWEKGYAELLEAIALVAKSIPDVALLVVGDGPARAELEAQARKLGVNNHLVALGEREPRELPMLYAGMDVLAAPSRFEGFGLAAAEAMAVGKPVVGFRVGGLAELVENGVTGYLVEPANVEALAGVLVELLPDRERAAQMGRRGRLRVEKYFSFENFSKQIGLAYQALERKHDPAPRRQRDLRSWQFLA